STLVLPLPAPARTSVCLLAVVTAASCSGFNCPIMRHSDADGEQTVRGSEYHFAAHAGTTVAGHQATARCWQWSLSIHDITLRAYEPAWPTSCFATACCQVPVFPGDSGPDRPVRDETVLSAAVHVPDDWR